MILRSKLLAALLFGVVGVAWLVLHQGQKPIDPPLAALRQDDITHFIATVSAPCCGIELGGHWAMQVEQGICRRAKLANRGYVYKPAHLSSWRALLRDHAVSSYARMVAASVLLENDAPQDGALAYLRIQALSDERRQQSSAVSLLSELSDPRVIPEVLRIFAAVAVAPPSTRAEPWQGPAESSLAPPYCRPDPRFPHGDRDDGARDPRESACAWLSQARPSSQEQLTALDACQRLGWGPR